MNINRDYLIINDVKKSNVKLDNGSMFFYITDKNTQNIFVNLVINVSNNELIQKYANIENAEDYTLTMNIVKPDNTYKIIEGKLHDKEKAIFEFDLPKECVDKIGTYKCELLTKCNINGHEEITTSNKLTYKVKSSVLNDLDDIVEAPEYPLVIQLFDKLSDINQYEEDRRANELARQLAEEQRQARFNTLDADIVDRITAMDDKMVDVENRVSIKEQAVDKLIVDTKADIDGYKEAKDQEIDEYKTAKDTEINNAIANQDNKIDEAINAQNNRIAVVENNDVAQNNRLDIVENKNTQQDNRLNDIEAKNVEQDNRLNEIEAIDVAQNNRLDAIEVKNQQQDDRLLDIEKTNKRQDMNLKCLFAESKNNMIDIAEEGNSIYLQNSTTGYTLIDEIKGNTLVNCNKEPNKELILNGNINTSGDNTVTITEGVDGGLVDVALEGNTLVNVSKTKDSIAISKAYTVENSGNHIALEGDIDGSCRPFITGNTLWIDNAMGEVLTAFDETKNLRLQSTFEDNLVTQEMVDSGEEIADNLGKYRVDYKSTREDGTVGSTKTLYLNSPLLEGDTIEEKDGGIYHVHRYTKVVLDGSDISKIIYYPDNSTGNTAMFTIKSDNSKIEGLYLCDKFINFNGNIWNVTERNDSECINATKSALDIILSISKNKLSSINSNGLSLYLQSNPITVVYELAEPVYELIEQSNLAIPSYVNGHLDFNTAVPVEKVDFLPFSEELTYLYPATSYTLQFISDKAITTDIALGGTKLLAQSIVKGLNRISITTPETLVDNKLIISGVGAKISKVVVTDTDRKFMYFEGMKSVGECEELEVKSGNKNLFDCELEVGAWNNYGGKEDNATTIRCSDLIEIKPNTSYIFSGSFIINNYAWIKVFSEDKTQMVQSYNLNNVIDTPSWAKYMVFHCVKENIDINGTVQLEEGSTATEYITHQSNIQTLTHEPLRAVGDAKDRYVLIDGKWYIERNCKEVNLSDFNKSWIADPVGVDFKRYWIGDFAQAFIVDNLPRITDEQWNAYNTPGVYLNNKVKAIGIVVPKNLSISEYVGNSRIIYRPKVYTPIYEPIDYNPLEVYSGTTHITTNSVIPCNITVKNHGYNCLLKPSTTYTISSNLGLNTVTTPSTLTEDCLRFMDTDTSDVTTMKNVLVLEGDWTTKADLIPANFSGIESCFEQEYDAEKGKYKVNVKVANEDRTKENNITFYIDKPLRGVGDVKDRVFIQDDKVVVERNCIVKTVNGSENRWTLAKDNGNNTTFYLRNNLFADANSDSLCICNLFTRDTTSGLIKVNNSMRITEHSGAQRLFLVPTKEKCSDLQSFKQWLQQNPTTVVYKLAEPVYEEVEYNDVKLFIESFKNSTLFYNSNVPVTSKLYYSYSVPIVDKVTQTASISDQQDSMIIDLATQVAVMEMMLM